jgi:hypothetical protein
MEDSQGKGMHRPFLAQDRAESAADAPAHAAAPPKKLFLTSFTPLSTEKAELFDPESDTGEILGQEVAQDPPEAGWHFHGLVRCQQDLNFSSAFACVLTSLPLSNTAAATC